MRCQKHDDRSYGRMLMATAHPPWTSPSIRSAGTTTSSKNTSANSGTPLIISMGETVIPGRVHVDEERGDARGGATRSRPVRVRSTQRSEYWARLVHTFWPLTIQRRGRPGSPSGTARQRSDARSLPGPGLREPLAPHLRAREQPGHDVGGELGRREVDERGRQHLDQREDAGVDEVARRPAPRRARCAASASRRGRRRARASPSASTRPSKRSAFTRCICATCSSSVPGGANGGASSSGARRARR